MDLICSCWRFVYCVITTLGCTGIILLIFLLPRTPRVYLQSSTVSFTPYQVVQVYKIQNNNLIPLRLSDVDLTMTSEFSLQGEYLVAYGSQYSSLEIPMLASKTVSITYLFNSTATQTTQASSRCFTSNGVSYVVQGTIRKRG